MKYRKDIDGLRAVAVSSVVLFHAGIPGFSGGFVGVDIFFVISGFLITTILKESIESGTFSLIEFYDRRIRRIFPALFTIYLVTLAVGLIVLMPDELQALGESLLASAGFSANIHFHEQAGYFDAPSIAKPLLHTWSLSVEEQFYFIWPLAMLAVTRHVRPHLWLPLLLTASALSLAYTEAEILWGNAERAFYMPHARAWELMMGALLAMTSQRIVIGKASRELMAGAGLLLIGGSIVLLSENQDFPGINALFPCLGAALLITAGMKAPTNIGRLLSTGPFVFVGLISYSVYLWHWPLFSFWRLSVGRSPSIGESVVLIGASLLLATATWLYIEIPFRQRGAGQQSRSKTMTLWTGLAAASIAAICGLTVAKLHGLPERLDVSIQELYKTAAKRFRGVKCAHEGADATTQPGCRLGRIVENRPADVVLIGDSHARHFASPIDSILKSKNLSGLNLSVNGCIALFGLRSYENGRELKNCSEHSDNVTQFLTEDAEAKLVVIAQRWESYTQSKMTESDNKTAKQLVDDRVTSPADIETTRHVLERALIRTVERLTKRGKRVLLIGQVPPYPSKPIRCVAKALYWEKEESACFASEREMKSRLDFSNCLIQKIASKYDRVDAFIPTDILCREGSCSLFLDGVFLYRDDDHLNAMGSRQFDKYMAQLPVFSEIRRLKLSSRN